MLTYFLNQYFILGAGSYVGIDWDQNLHGPKDEFRLLILLALVPKCQDLGVLLPWPNLYMVCDLTHGFVHVIQRLY